VDTVHECDRQTDRQTDRITIPKTVQRRASHGKNSSEVKYCKVGQACSFGLTMFVGRLDLLAVSEGVNNTIPDSGPN